MHSAMDHSQHTRFSDPGEFAELLADVAVDVESLSAVSRNVIVHYRASGHELPDHSRGDINSRWLERALAVDQSRHAAPLDRAREVTERVQGCCRDHTLFCVGALRHHGVPARSRVGFGGYFIEGWHHDHVIVEAWMNGRWRRFDSEVEEPPAALPSAHDIEWDEPGGSGFVTAAQAWAAHRRGDIDASKYGVDPLLPQFAGPRFIFDQVIHEVAHRFGDELLLWDAWGRMGELEEPVSDADARWLDEIAALLLASDRGDAGAEEELLTCYRADPGLHPGETIIQASPYGDPPMEVRLER